MCIRDRGGETGLEVEVFDREAIMQLGLGGLLGVNAGSAEEPRMVKLRYTPEGATDETPHLALVGKGIMFDSGGISLKPTHAMGSMKMDMMGAGAVLASMTALRELGATSIVTGWMMCTDNTVSYTHLDVYKRQAPRRTACAPESRARGS